MSDESNEHQIDGAILVGVDGSPISHRALGWAARQAELTKRPLHAVRTWEYPVGTGFDLPVLADFDLAANAKEELDAAIREILGEQHGIEVWASVVEGHPAPTLLRLSEHAELVVVGSRGHGAFTGMLLGSTSLFLATHCHCPVVIMREPPEEH